MANPVTLLYIGTAITAGAAIYQGRQAAQAEAFRQKQLEDQAMMAQIQARDDAIKRQQELNKNLGIASAMGAQAGFDPFSLGSSFLANTEEMERRAETDIEMIRLLGSHQATRFKNEIRQSKMTASAAKTGSFLKAASTVATGAYEAKTVQTPSATGTR